MLRDFFRQLTGRNVDLRRLILQIVFREHHPRSPESIGLDDVATNLQKAAMNVLDDVTTAEHQQFIASFLPPEIIHTRIPRLDTSPHSAVVNHDTLIDGL